MHAFLNCRTAWLVAALLLALTPGCGTPGAGRSLRQDALVQFVEPELLEPRRPASAPVEEEPADGQLEPPLPEAITPPLPSARRAAPAMPDDGLRPIGQVTINAAPKPVPGARNGQLLPPDAAAELFGAEPTQQYYSEPFQPWGAYDHIAWDSGFCHRPLYFEDPNLERHGHSWGPAQPLVSAGKFFATVPALPYKMVVDPPGVCQADRHPYPAGTPAPPQHNLPPFQLDAAVVQAATVVAIILLFP